LISTVYLVLPESKVAIPYPVMDFIMRKDSFFRLFTQPWQQFDQTYLMAVASSIF
jgi:hypothetical protein